MSEFSKKTFHVVNLPHTSTTKKYSSCAFTEKVRKFCIMMINLGHDVFLYGGPDNEAPCTEHISCITHDLQEIALGDNHYTQVDFNPLNPLWTFFNSQAVKEIKNRIRPKDIICLIGGGSQKLIADSLPRNPSVEFGIGYHGIFAKYKVFESYAWMHTHYGARFSYTDTDGDSSDTVIPSYIDVADFTYVDTPKKYIAYVGRMIERKGINIAADACRLAGVEFITAGPGSPLPGVQHLGELGPKARDEFMGNASALIAPTIYIEPFGTVAVEAMACGTPVISSDWGAFTETVIEGVTGFRCRTLDAFVESITNIGMLDRKIISNYARSRYGLESVAVMYDKYFDHVIHDFVA